MRNDPDLTVDGVAGRTGDRLGWPRALAATVVLGGLFVTLILLAINLSNQIEELQSEPEDNAQWVMSQIEVELGRLEGALVAATLSSRPLLPNVRQRFDIFYSRVEVLENGRLGQILRALDGTEATLVELKAFLDRYVADIDGPDGALYTVIPFMRRDVAQLRPAVRSLALEGVTHFAERSEARRRHLYNQLVLTGLVAAFLIVALMSAITILTRQMARVAAQDVELRRSEGVMASTVSSSLDPIIVED
ncbi:MAG: hypothetical protein AAFQ51_12605, partial [Pseudomonadota bacterium]